MYEQWCFFCHPKGLPVLEVHIYDLIEYLYVLLVSDDYAYKVLYMHASTAHSILQLVEQKGDLMIPIVRQLLKGLFRYNLR